MSRQLGFCGLVASGRVTVALALLVMPCPVVLSKAYSQESKKAEVFEMLKDIQSTNLSTFKIGSFVARVAIVVGASESKPVRANLEAEVTWNEEQIFWKFRATDPQGSIIGMGPIESEPSKYFFMLKDKDRVSSYNAKLNRVFVRSAKGSIPPIFNLIPSESWFRCCPPDTLGGRPWVEMLSMSSKLPGVSNVEVKALTSDKITVLRTDRDRSTAEIEFSLAHGGNVTRINYSPATPDTAALIGSYEWNRRSDGIFVLDGCHFEEMVPGMPGQRGTVYDAKYTDFVIGTRSGQRDSPKQKFQSYLPKDVKVKDDKLPIKAHSATQGRMPMEKIAVMAQELKKRGFLRRVLSASS
ncbi:hypothetical protein SAMN05444166_5041 [Singulisphaera sp. GP187]|uniref:hypothetical protein n=1 Tax=Singulisphaera sp. GP187 TaxID=1882752 RepID=UPI00092921BC|nr:hypothetical protein [Singulisphaera sp. GP187]SIO47291.1 hypothetical protein SAMN05444166_5041 [Singulisphaera sp. GP187]